MEVCNVTFRNFKSDPIPIYFILAVYLVIEQYTEIPEVSVEKKLIELYQIIKTKQSHLQNTFVDIDMVFHGKKTKIQQIFERCIKDHQFYIHTVTIAEAKHLLKLYLDPPNNIVQMVLEYSGSDCILTYRGNNQCRGSLSYTKPQSYAATCTIFESNDVKIGHSRIKKCNKCHAKYQYGKITLADKSIILLDPEELYYMELSTSTYISHETLLDYAEFNFADGVGATSYVENYNKRLREKTRNIGRRLGKRGYANMHTNRLNICFFMYMILKLIYHELLGNNLMLLISIQVIDKYKKKKQSIQNILRNNINQNNQQINAQSDHQIHIEKNEMLFQILFDEYFSELRKIPQIIPFYSVGVINYKYLDGWWVVYGDGGQKISRLICNTPIFIFKCFK